ncbi:MAG: hypothetical protein CVV02_03375 [Firmicutes bacterium HGW-Firmicutes-7]|nr:MAG: hypothetical protein CVV02_03375 [Firmicutes bacterium HGW-Firmicutes-7]
MKEETLTYIVNEVVRRVKLLLNTHSGLLIIRKNTDYILLNILLMSMKNNGYIFDVLVLTDSKELIELDDALEALTFIKAPELQNHVEGIHKYEVVIVSNLNIMEIGKISNLKIEDDFLYLLYEALKEGKTVIGFSKDLDIKNNINLRNLTLKLSATLEEIGLKLITRKDALIRLDSNIITLEQVKGINGASVIINKTSILTSTAKDYLSQNKIEILRR